jgi:two-component system sensor histidine kinase RstB
MTYFISLNYKGCRMRSIFFRIYMGIFLAIIIIVLVMAAGTYYVNKQRITHHVEKNYGGTFKLIAQGLQRHQAEQRVKWLAAIETLSDLEFQQLSSTDNPLKSNIVNKLHDQQYAFEVDNLLTAGKVYILYPDKNQYLEVKLSDFGSSLVRLSAFLMLNEIGRHKSEQRLQALKDLREIFAYPIQLKPLAQLDISTTNARTIEKGDISVVLKNPTSSTPSLMAYAPIGNSPYALVVGSIPFFDWFPLDMIILEVSIVLILMALTSFLLVRPLEKRLQQVDKQIEAVGRDHELVTVSPKKGDAIGNLVNTVNAMATRIHRLIDGQKNMIRAISHELRTPIARIRFRIAVIEESEEIKSPKIITQGAGIEKDLSELETLIDEVLTFSKLQSDIPKLQQEHIDIRALYKKLLASVGAINPNITVNLINDDQENFFADQRYIYRALENLVLNAQKYTKNQIDVGFARTASTQQIFISDNGPGIPDDEHETLFEPFKRLDRSRDRKTGGYGLGLAIVKQIIQWHQGKISIEKNEYNGAKIIIELPLHHRDKSLQEEDK